MQTTFDGWIMNPMVKSNSVFTHRDMYRKMYTEKFDKILLREAGKIDYKLYIDKDHDKYYAHIKVPSEVVPKFYYDVVVEFFAKDNAIRANKTLTDYFVRFYSNDPAFVFTYLRVFRKNDMFLEELAPKTPKEALKKDPDIKNPNEVIMYVKSLYFAFLFMKAKNLFSKVVYETYGEKFNNKVLVARVRNANDVIEERRIKGEEIEKQKREDNKKAKPTTQVTPSPTMKNSTHSKRGNVVTVAKTTRTGSTVKTTKTVKKI